MTKYDTFSNLFFLPMSLLLCVSPSIFSIYYSVGKDFKEDLEFLLQGVSGFDLQGDFVASEALVHGPLAFPIGTTEDERVFLAGTYYGRGRVIVVTHEAFIQLEVQFE